MLYLDAGVFIYAALNRQTLGKKARALLQKISDGKLEAASCTLAFDEIMWVVAKHRSREDAITAAAAFLALPNLKLLAVNQDSLFSALTLMRRYSLDPRDAIHVSTAIINGCQAIVSADTHFDHVVEIPRRRI